MIEAMRGVSGIGMALLVLSLSPTALAAAARDVSAPDFSAIDAAARDAVVSGEIPGLVILVGQGDHILYHRFLGWRQLAPTPEPMTGDTVFDIASLTKPLGTTLAVLSLVERGKIRLDAPLGAYLPEFRSRLLDRTFKDVTIRRMLTHSAGFAAAPRDRAVAVGFPRAARELANLKLDYPPGTGTQYSDTGFILLGEVVRRASGLPLDQYLSRWLFGPLGLSDTTFHPNASLRARAAPTEFHGGHWLRGEVHDPHARLLGGVAGHAGMFSTARDLARLCRLLVNEGVLDGRRWLRPETVRAMWTPWPHPQSPRALGWDVTSGFASAMAPFFPAGSVGHTGFTGTAVWLDPQTRVYMIILTNRVHPNGGGAARVRELRTRVAAAVGGALFRPVFVIPPAMPPELPETLPELSVPGSVGSPDGPAPVRSPEHAGPASLPAPPPPGTAPPPARSGAEPAPTPEPSAVAPAGAPNGRVQSGLDVLVSQGFAPLRGHTVGLVTNHSGIDAAGRRAIDLLAAAPAIRLGAIFSPEHGLSGDANANVPHGRDPATGRTVWSLYGPTRRPSPEMLRGLTALVFDIQDVGVRYYTYLTTLIYTMEEAARHRIPVFVLDRPNPITGRVVEGPVADRDLLSFTAPHTIPVRTGLTIGEFGRFAAAERGIDVALTVVPLVGWERSRWFDETGLPWTNPSPNIRSVTQALLYSGVGLLEATNLSVGRGTSMPFEVVGAPWIDAQGLAQALNARRLAGVRFYPIEFTPAADVYAGMPCAGVRLVVTDREAIRPVTAAFALASELRSRHRSHFRSEAIQNLLVNRATMWALLRDDPVERLLAWGEAMRASFLQRRASYLIYP
jgi:uncharacterized protein YbbC (DUF1343 family)/CubicO group peptidase (beta-lactamase class C family)